MAKSRKIAIPLVIREQLEALTKERDIARCQAEDLSRQLDEMRAAVSGNVALYTTVKSDAGALRAQLEEMRKQRDFAQGEAENARLRLRITEIDLARAMGWIDAKRDCPPAVDTDARIPL